MLNSSPNITLKWDGRYRARPLALLQGLPRLSSETGLLNHVSDSIRVVRIE